MRTRISIGLNVVLGTVLLVALLGQNSASSAGIQILNLPAVSFVPRDATTHDGDCNAPTNSKPGEEFRGQLANGAGGYIQFVRLGQGQVVKSFSLFANDFDGDNIHAYLLRKQVTKDFTPKADAYKVMASTQTKGSVDNKIRKFTDTTISGGVIDNTKYIYYAELVVCGNTEPYSIQIGYTG